MRNSLVAILMFLSWQCIAAENITYVISDFKNSPIAYTDQYGDIVSEQSYSSFGESSSSANDGRFDVGFHGKEQDHASGLINFGARFYDPDIGRFITPDPVGFDPSTVKSFNRYAFANNNPHRFTDPDGRFIDIIVDVASVGLGVYSFAKNAIAGNWESAGLDAAGVAVDIASAVVPGAVSGVGIARHLADDAVEFGHDVTKGADDYVDLASPQRRRHILDGDATGGGHRPGTGKPGKSEFPQGWSDDRIMHEISDVATDPRSVTRAGRGGRTITEGTRDGIDIRVIQERNGDIVSGFPTNLPRISR